MWRIILGLVLLGAAMPARAEWMSATSRHFIVYSDSNEAGIRALATELEQFDAAVRFFHSMPDAPESASNRLTVYVVPSVASIQRLCERCGNVAGFYNGRASGSVAYTPRRGQGSGPGDLKPRTVLFHEYAHHFLLGNSGVAYPAWYSEGYAEFVSTMQPKAGDFLLGAAANHRAYGLFGIDFPIERLFAPPGGQARNDVQLEGLYGRGWLLTHYLIFDRNRAGQLNRYLRLFNAGTPSLEAAKTVFGDLKVLDRELNTYLRSSSLSAVRIPGDKIPAPAITIRALTPGERALIELREVSDRGVDSAQAKALYKRAAPIAARFPDDATAQGWFAEIAFDAGDEAAAEAAANRALAARPDDMQALLYKANIALHRLATGPADASGWNAARKLVIRANHCDPDSAEPLMLFYTSFALEHRDPTKSAIAGLYRAQELVPQDEGLRWLAAQQRIEDDDLAGARKLLRPLAFSPHAAADNDAVKLLAMLDASKSKDDVHVALAAAAQKAKAAAAKTSQ